MVIDRSHKRWMLFALAATVVCGAHYAVYRHASYTMGGNGPSGATWTGLAYGIVALLVMMFCGLLGVRKTFRTWRLGRAETWLRAHIWLGLLTLPFVLFHSGFRLGNALSFWTMLVFLIVLVSGIVGVLLQNTIPRAMLTRVQAETTFEQIPHVIDTLREEAEQIVVGVCGPISNEPPAAESNAPNIAHAAMKKDGAVQGKVVRSKGKSAGPVEGSGPLKVFFLNEVQPFLGQKFVRHSRLSSPQGSAALFTHARTLIPETLHESLKDLESICDERRQLALQTRLHFWLHSWEFLHIPLSYALMIFVVIHVIVSTFRYSGFLHR